MVNLAIPQRPVVPKRLQGSCADIEHPAHVLIVHPLVHFLFAVSAADAIHPTDEAVEFGDQFLKGLSFD